MFQHKPQTAAYPPVGDGNATFLGSPLIAQIVGKNVVAYRKKWAKILNESGGNDERVLAQTSWNWSACIFTAGWLFYRKMYLYGVICFGAEIALDALSTKLPVWIVASVIVGMLGNSLYLYRVARIYREAETIQSQSDRDSYVSAQGQTKLAYGIAASIAALALSALVEVGGQLFVGDEGSADATFEAGKMPVCESGVVRDLLKKTLEDSSFAAGGLKVFKLGDFVDISPRNADQPIRANPPTRTCMGEVFSSRGHLQVQSELSWTDKDRDELYLNVVNVLGL